MYDLIIILSTVLVLTAVGYFWGKHNENAHYESIRKREEELRGIMVFAVKTIPDHIKCKKAEFVSGSVVISIDYFKSLWAMFASMKGGNIIAYETLVERGRREAILRMKEEAKTKGATYIINPKFSTANILSRSDSQNGGCIEVIAYGTALVE